MDNLFNTIKQQLYTRKKQRIVFPEATDERVLRAANQLAEEDVLEPVYIGCELAIKAQAEKYRINLVNYEIINPKLYAHTSNMLTAYMKRRGGNITLQQAEETLADDVYFGTMLVYLNEADGLVSGATHTTTDAVLPALRLIKTKAGVKKTSGAFLMMRGSEQYIFADCAVNIMPSSEELAEIAIQSAKTARLFQMEPRVAMLSFSTKGSAHSVETIRVREATQLAKEKEPSLVIDGELQFDAAFLPELAAIKAPDSVIAGNANVFVFPDLGAGNLSCKITERLGGFAAVGPILQGLAKPINLLSRGCSIADIYKVALITAMQASKQEVV